MKILVLHHNRSGEGGGILTYCNELKKLIDGVAGIEMEVAHLDPALRKYLKRKYDPEKLRRAIIEYAPDVVHVNGTTSYCAVQGIRMAKKLGKRVVLTPHWHPFMYMNHPWQAKIFFHVFIRPILRLVDTIVTINDEEYRFFSRYHRNVILIPHWLRDTLEAVPESARKPGGILLVGRLNDPNKGVDYLYSLPKGKYQISCVGKGKITERDDIRQYNGLSDEELKQKYREASLVVVPSRYEAFSYVALEALSHGVPVLMSDRVRIADSIENIGECCRVFKYGDYKDFVDKIDEAMSLKFDPHKALRPFFPKAALTKYKVAYGSVPQHKEKSAASDGGFDS